MSVHYTGGYISGTSKPMTYPRILWDPLDVDAVTSSGAEGGHPEDRVVVPDTSTWWLSTTGSATRTLTLDFGVLKTLDAIGIAGHNLGGQTLLIEGATNVGLTTWATLDTILPADDSTLLSLVTSGSYYGVRLTVTATDVDVSTKISVVYVGQALVMPVRGYNDLGPVDLGMEVGISTYRTETGQLAGRFINYAGLTGNLMFTHLPEDWVRETLMPFLKKAITIPFFLANRPQGYATDCAFAWTTDNVIPQRMRLKNFMSVQMKVNAHAPVSLF